MNHSLAIVCTSNLDLEDENLRLAIVVELLKGAMIPVVLFVMFLITMSICKSTFSASKRFKLSLVANFIFLVGSIGGVLMTSDVLARATYDFGIFSFGVCGLGVSLFAYRLNKLREIPRWSIIVWRVLTFPTLVLTVGKGFALVR